MLGHAVLADRRTLGAMRTQIDRGVEDRLLPGPDAVFDHGVDRTSHRTVGADGALDFHLLGGLRVLRLRLADHGETEVGRHRAGAQAKARIAQERAPVKRLECRCCTGGA